MIVLFGTILRLLLSSCPFNSLPSWNCYTPCSWQSSLFLLRWTPSWLQSASGKCPNQSALNYSTSQYHSSNKMTIPEWQTTVIVRAFEKGVEAEDLRRCQARNPWNHNWESSNALQIVASCIVWPGIGPIANSVWQQMPSSTKGNRLWKPQGSEAELHLRYQCPKATCIRSWACR